MCKKIKLIKNFYKDKSRTDGFAYRCNDCAKLHSARIRSKNKYKTGKQHNENKKCSKCKTTKQINEFNRYASSTDGFDHICRRCRAQRYIDNKKDIKIKRRQYYLANKQLIRKAHYDYDKQKKKTNIEYRLRSILRIRINKATKNNQKAGSAVKDLGCQVRELKQHLESMFYSHPKTGKQMSWNNYGLYGWHIDHIIPLASFRLTDREQFLKACHYTNLQPLWAEDNLSKSCKIIL